MILKCLIIDDEPPAHKVLENYIAKLNSLTLAGNCYNAIEAVDFLHNQQVDIVFLDINMPEMSGLEFLKTLHNPPNIILTTAYSEFALESYEFGVIDYLLKPIRFDRFLKAVNRILQMQSSQESSGVLEKKEEEPKETFFFVKADGIQHKVVFSEIQYIESQGNFVQLHLDSKKILTAETLSKMEKKLSEFGFMRVHKSYVVNKKRVEGIRGNQLIFKQAKVPIGNSYKMIVLGELGL